MIDLEEARKWLNHLISNHQLKTYETMKALITEVEKLRELVSKADTILDQMRLTAELLLRGKSVRNLDEVFTACDNLRTKIAELEEGEW